MSKSVYLLHFIYLTCNDLVMERDRIVEKGCTESSRIEVAGFLLLHSSYYPLL